jgi:acetyltransferase-like isoleucine patch superfamily enzyme
MLRKILKIPMYLYTVIKLKSNRVEFNYKVLGNGFYIKNKGRIVLGKSVYLHSYPDGYSYRTALSTYFPESIIKIGDNCALNGVNIHSNEKVIIGNYCLIGPGTTISDNNSHRVVKDIIERRMKSESKPIIIQDNVWIGSNCLIMKGVTIGVNSIIAAGSLVLKDVPPNCLYGGHPAVLIKKLE